MSDGSKKWPQTAAGALKGWRDDLSQAAARAGDLAALGRLAGPLDALLPCFAELCNRACGAGGIDKHRLEVLARCAFLAGRLSRFEQGASLAAGMSRRLGPGRPLVSPVRAA